MSSNRQVSTSPILASHDTRSAIPTAYASTSAISGAYASIPAAYTATAGTNGSSALISNSNSEFLSGTKQQSINDDEQAYQTALRKFADSQYSIKIDDNERLNDSEIKELECDINKSLASVKNDLKNLIVNHSHKDKKLCTQILNETANLISNGENQKYSNLIDVIEDRYSILSSESKFMRSIYNSMTAISILSFVVSFFCLALAPFTVGLSLFVFAILTSFFSVCAFEKTREKERSNINHDNNVTRKMSYIEGYIGQAQASVNNKYSLYQRSQNPQGAATSTDNKIDTAASLSNPKKS